MTMKPHFRIVGNRPVSAGVRQSRETPLEAARRRYGRPFCSEPFRTGEGPRYWTGDRIEQLRAENEARRKARA